MMNYEKSLLPKLLAKENITIRHGNFNTAWFDIKNRTLGLPLWKDMGKDVYDLLIGHEVGHAIETPYEGWHDSPEKLEGCPRTYINVIEDARIERKIQSRYPGLVNSFNKGYKKLLEREFFGPLDDVDYDQVKLIDKINLKTKLGSLIEVPFNSEEMVYLTRAKTTQTFDEVVQLVKDILKFTQDNTPELIQQPEPEPEDSENQESEENNNQEDMPSGHDDYEKEESDDESTQSKSGNQSSEESEEGEESDDTETVTAKEPVHTAGSDVSITDSIYRSKEKELIETDRNGNQPIIISQTSADNIETSIVDFKELSKERETEIKRWEENYKDSSWGNQSWRETISTGYASYMKQLKKNVQPAVREFEMKKAATQWSRATEAKTGNINVNKLWSYKTNDDIFLKATKLPNAKSHGMVMLVDYSGSMSTSMKYVMDQILHTVMFCKAVNIPYEVYAFTSGGWYGESQARQYQTGDLDMDDLRMPLLVSSDMKKADFIKATQFLYLRTTEQRDIPKAHSENWGSTPLNQALVVMHDIIKRFRAKNNIEKMNFLTFTDGDANRIQVHGNRDYRNKTNEIRLIVQGKSITSGLTSATGLTTVLLNNIKKQYKTNNLGFFMADDNSEWKYRINNAYWAESARTGSEEYRKEKNKEYNKNKCVEVSNVFGYDTYYMVKGGKNLNTEEEDFEVQTEASDAQIRNAFKKYSKSKKTNKVLLTKFGGAVA